jgi:hypothetical protein
MCASASRSASGDVWTEYWPRTRSCSCGATEPRTNSAPAVRRAIMEIRHSSLYAPRDFDISPYFTIIKPTLVGDFNYKCMDWADRPAPLPACATEVILADLLITKDGKRGPLARSLRLPGRELTSYSDARRTGRAVRPPGTRTGHRV